MDTQQLIAEADRFFARTYNRAPFVLSHGRGVEVWDTDGRRYLDFVAGIAVNALGHADPTTISVLQEQAAKLTHVSNLYWSEPGIEFARLLVHSCFADKVFLCNSGAEAVEGAIKFARKIGKAQDAGKTAIVAFEHSFHGRTTGALATTHKAAYREPFEPLLPGVRFAPFNDLDTASTAVDDSVCAR
jgi:acetylornithine/N-succinyldiaminopimelate aminotransferase